MKNRLLRILAALLLLCAVLPLTASAWETVDVDRKCSLTIRYSSDFSGQEIQIYRVAEIYADGSFELVVPFSEFQVDIQGISSQMEWQRAADTLASNAIADQIPPTAKVLTDANGDAVFSQLQTGIYLVQGLVSQKESGTYRFKNFCVFVPTPLDDGTLNYDVTAIPKPPEAQKPEDREYQVTKLWKDTGFQSKRPSKVTVDILKDGSVQETVTLNSGNNWTYCWKAPADGGVWTVVEKDVPDEYTVVITDSGTSFTITNSRTSSGGSTQPGKTGDTFSLRTWLLVMNLSGMLLVLLGMGYKRKRG